MEKIAASNLVYVDDQFIEEIRQKLETKDGEAPIPASPIKKYYTLKEVAAHPDVFVCQSTLRLYVQNYVKGRPGFRLIAKKQGRTWLISHEELIRLIN